MMKTKTKKKKNTLRGENRTLSMSSFSKSTIGWLIIDVRLIDRARKKKRKMSTTAVNYHLSPDRIREITFNEPN